MLVCNNNNNNINSLLFYETIYEQMYYVSGDLLRALINLHKPIIAACNGPAIGISCTLLALCDIVYAADKCYFKTPFMELGFCAEGRDFILLFHFSSHC